MKYQSPSSTTWRQHIYKLLLFLFVCLLFIFIFFLLSLWILFFLIILFFLSWIFKSGNVGEGSVDSSIGKERREMWRIVENIGQLLVDEGNVWSWGGEGRCQGGGWGRPFRIPGMGGTWTNWATRWNEAGELQAERVQLINESFQVTFQFAFIWFHHFFCLVFMDGWGEGEGEEGGKPTVTKKQIMCDWVPVWAFDLFVCGAMGWRLTRRFVFVAVAEGCCQVNGMNR